jgi:hypothetical protein
VRSAITSASHSATAENTFATNPPDGVVVSMGGSKMVSARSALLKRVEEPGEVDNRTANPVELGPHKSLSGPVRYTLHGGDESRAVIFRAGLAAIDVPGDNVPLLPSYGVGYGCCLGVEAESRAGLLSHKSQGSRTCPRLSGPRILSLLVNSAAWISVDTP